MGWLFYRIPEGRSRKAECDSVINCASDNGTWEVLKSAMVGSTYYAAVRKTPKDGAAPYVFAAIFLTKGGSRGDDMNFGYKDMDESVGPCESQCPVGILDMLTPLAAGDKSYAADWRARCRANLEKKKNKPKVGDMIVLAEPLKFTDGNMLDTFILEEGVRRGRKYKRFRSTVNGGYYSISRFMEREFTVGKVV